MKIAKWRTRDLDVQLPVFNFQLSFFNSSSAILHPLSSIFYPHPRVPMETFFQDLRLGLRMLLKNPGFTAVAIVALALGIGANTAIFSVVNAVMLRPLAFKDPDRRVQPPIQRGSISRPDFFEWQSHNEAFKQFAGYYYQTFNLTGVDEAEQFRACSPGDQGRP